MIDDCPECTARHTSRGVPSVFSRLGRNAPPPPQEPINDDYPEECCLPRWCPDGLSRTQKRRVERLWTLEQVEEEYLQLLRVAQVKPIPKPPTRRLKSMVWRWKANADEPSAAEGSSVPKLA